MPVDDRAVLAAILQAAIAKRRKVFVSYHHQGDQYYYDAFSLMFHDQFGLYVYAWPTPHEPRPDEDQAPPRPMLH